MNAAKVFVCTVSRLKLFLEFRLNLEDSRCVTELDAITHH